MNKREKITLGIVLFVLAIALIFVVSNNFFLSTTSGFSTLSLGQVNFNSNDPTVGGQAWLLTVSQNGAGQSAYGTFTAKDSSSGATSDQFTLTTSLDKNFASYPIYNQGDYIYHIEYTTTVYNPFGALGGCNPDVWQGYYKPSLSITSYCYKLTNDGVYGTVGSANQNFQTTINVQGSGGTANCVVSNNAQTSCSSNDGKIFVNWVGSLVSGQALPQPTDQNIISIYNTNKGGWTTSKGQYYSSWKTSADQNNLVNCIASQHSTSCFDDANNLENILMNGAPFTTYGGVVAVSQGNQYNGQLIMNLPTQVQFPVLTMRIKASVVGINIPVGKPQITAVSSTKFQTGSSGIITATISNVGTGVGSFDVYASCSSGFSQTGNALRISGLAQGISQTVYLPITSNIASGDLQGSCVVNANDVNNPANADSRTVSVSSSSIAICTANDLRISGNDIQQCKNNAWVTIQSCTSTQIAQYVGTTPKCVEKGDGGGSGGSTCAWYDIGCHFNNWFGGFFSTLGTLLTIFKVIFILIVLLLVFFVTKDITQSKIIKNRKDKPFVYLIAFLASALVGVALYAILLTALFWIIIFALIVISIILKLIPSFRRR